MCRVIALLVIVLTIFHESEEPDGKVCGREKFGKGDKYVVRGRDEFKAGFDN